jgi:hypothetical protein
MTKARASELEHFAARPLRIMRHAALKCDELFIAERSPILCAKMVQFIPTHGMALPPNLLHVAILLYSL